MGSMKSTAEFLDFSREISEATASGTACLIVCAGTGGQASGSNDIIRAIKRKILERNLGNKISLRITGCLGFCEMDPFILVEPSHAMYPKLKCKDVPKIIEAVLADTVVEDLLYREPGSSRSCVSQNEIPFFKGQTRTVLGNNQRIDPVRIVDYIKVGGYGALIKVLDGNESGWIIEEMKKSGLRGRGGAGFPTGKKWELAKNAGAGQATKFIVCNADEGDPGAYMDRSMLEGNPHAIIEGMIIAAAAIGATDGIIYVRSEYPLAIKHTAIALRQARGMGLLGENILGSTMNFNIVIVQGAGAFVCGEETALIKSIEGRMGEPRQRPPYPIAKGIHGFPTCINNVETLANVPIVIGKGGDEFARIGVAGNTGTKIFSLVGKIKNTGLVEVPMGMPLKKMVYEIGGGPSGKARIKAVQTGGPSGGCIPASMFDLPISYDSLTKAGSIMGSGGMIVMDENTCMVDVARYFMNFLKDESCGKCFTCRKGTQRMWEILDDISRGKGSREHVALLEELALVVKDTTMCGLGQTASNPVLSTLKYFREEYERHVVDKRCDAFVCKQMVGAPCQAACPVDTEPWRYVAHAAKGEYEEAYKIIREANPFPAVSSRVCDRKCESRCSLGVSGGESVGIRALKRFITDRVDPSVYRPVMPMVDAASAKNVAVIGAGPAGLTAAYYLSLLGHRVTIYETQAQAGGMLTCSLPAYRLPRNIVLKEIETLLNPAISLKFGMTLGTDITLDGLFADGFDAVFLAIGAHRSWRLDLPGEDLEGVIPSMRFLKEFNINGVELAAGHVGIIGGGNSAVDAARVALRQKKVTQVTLFYRRTRDEMPAYEEEIDAALEEGVRIETLVSPVKIRVRQEDIRAAVTEGVELETLVSPKRIISREGRLTGIECIRNRLGEMDVTGRHSPVAVPGSEFTVALDTLIVAIGEKPDSGCLASTGLHIDKNGRIKADRRTLATNLKGVFAGGDLVSGPNTVIDAIAAGKKAAASIDRYLNGRETGVPARVRLPTVYIEPVAVAEPETAQAQKVHPPSLPVVQRTKNFKEVELALFEKQAISEARRCLRCDLAFTNELCVVAPEAGEKKT